MSAPRPAPAPPDGRPPRQDRSRRTLERILSAAERLLRRKPFEAITIEELVRAARTSTGALYSRVGSKEGLLPLLYARYDANLYAELEPLIAETARKRLGLEALARAYVRTTIRRFTRHRWLVHAIGLHVRAHPEVLSAEGRARRRALHDRAGAVFSPHAASIGGDDAAERVRQGLYFATAVLRDKIVFGGAPHAGATPLAGRKLEDEVTRMLLAYLKEGKKGRRDEGTEGEARRNEVTEA